MNNLHKGILIQGGLAVIKKEIDALLENAKDTDFYNNVQNLNQTVTQLKKQQITMFTKT